MKIYEVTVLDNDGFTTIERAYFSAKTEVKAFISKITKENKQLNKAMTQDEIINYGENYHKNFFRTRTHETPITKAGILSILNSLASEPENG